MQPMFGSQPLMNFMMLISMLIPLFARIAECSWQFQFPTNYSRRQRPLLDQSQPITVQYKITITQLIALDEKQQEMCCKVWIDQKWTDEYLKWDLESDTNDSNQSSSDSSSSAATEAEEQQPQQTTEFRPQWMSFRPGEIWTPDIAIDNSISVERENFDIKVYNDGSIWWSIPAITRTTCYIKTEQFPFDQQECDIVVGSWYYQPNEINLIVEGNATKMELKYAAENAQWQFLDSWILTEDEKHDTYDMVFRTLHFRIKFKRKSLYYCLILIVPYILISFVSLANFILPCESGEKIALGITVLLSQFVNLLNLVDLIPESSDSFPVLGLYYLVSMALCALSVILTVLILNIHFQADNSKRLPSYVRVLFLQYLRIFFLPGTKYEAFGKEKSGQKSSNKHPKSFMNFKFSRNK
ncbi:neuronal acetylcholine receptor subunit alpha-9-like [Convolutriloba macropyga]|uniref:neuronal acetylcholine receptor subunit alpha-9-like n=1 Tax=Convolutriloba macropyga TaxID=536237 RepID=UPI003F51E62E